MAVQFPDPIDNPVFVAPNGVTYRWDENDYIWRAESGISGADYILSEGDTMNGDLNFSGTNKVITRHIDSGQNSNLELKHNGTTRIFVGGSTVSINNSTTVKNGSAAIDDSIFSVEGSQANGGTGDKVLNVIKKGADGDQLRYYGPVTFNKEVATKEYIDNKFENRELTLEQFEQINYQPLKEDLIITVGTWTGSAGDGNLKIESLEDVSTHTGWRPDNTGKIFIGQALKFVHDSGVRYGRVQAVWGNSNTTHLTVGEWEGDPFVQGEKTTVEYQKARFVSTGGDTMTGNLTIMKIENGPASGGTQGQEAKLILNGDRNGTSDAVATVEFKSQSSASGKTGYLAYYSGDADAGKTIFTLNKPLETGGLYVNANNKGKTDGPGSHEYSFVVNSSGYSSFFVQGNNAYVRNDIFIGAYSENDNFSGAKKVATEEVAAKYRTRLDLGAYKYRRSTDSWGSGGIQSNTTTNTGDMLEFKIHHTNVNGIQHTKQLLDQSVGGKMYIGLYRTNDNFYQGRITSVDRTDNKGVIVTCTLTKQKGTFTLDSTIWVTLSYNPQEMYVHTLNT